jgi:hypothetical protein
VTHITAIRRYGTRWLILLACGHQFTVSSTQLRAQQLYLGKVMECHLEHTR